MANPEHLAILERGVKAWNEWREQPKSSVIPPVNIDLKEANLHKARLGGADFHSVVLSSSDLSQADLNGANFSYAWVSKANLHQTDLHGANLFAADFSEANLTYANIRLTKLDGTILTKADLSYAAVGRTTFGDLDLSSVIGLDLLDHVFPSTVGIDTVLRSKGTLPMSFLHRAGVPDFFSSYIKSIIGSAIEFYSCFISYSTKDQSFANRLYADLQAKGVRCWFASHDVQGGRKLHEQIDEAIRLHDKLLFILSPYSMVSEWVKTEISKARKREVRDKAQVLFPIGLAPFEAIRDWECFDADTGKDSAREIREYFIPDFSNWKDHDSYQKEFDRLVRDLQASSPVPAHTQR